MAPKVSLSAARKIVLGAQGFAAKSPKAVGARQFASVMARLGLIQLDSVNVCVRSHYMPFYSRLGSYDCDALDGWINTTGRHFEYWAHEASVMPAEAYPLWVWRMKEWQPWKRAVSVMEEHPELRDDVLAQVRERGPISVKELEAPKARTRPWWGYGPGKIVLEHLFATGELTALRGKNFSRKYDLPERAIPASHREGAYEKLAAHKELLLRSVRHLGIGTAKDIADYYRLKIGKCRPLLAELAAEGSIDEVAIPGWKGPVYRDPGAKCPRGISGAALLSPFDPVTWYRDRAERLFDFHYRIEIYTPAEKRKFGYYVLPFLLDGELVGRVDLKADRKENVLRVPSAFCEEGQDKARVSAALSAELERFAAWRGLSEISLGRKGNLMSSLRAARG